VSFEEAITAFSDLRGLLVEEPDHSEDERRYVILGVSERDRLLSVIHCYRESAKAIRIISARKATRSERTQYERG
jgi:uncharacterized DUF497 family protein